MELVSNSACLYSTIQCLHLSMDSRIPSLSRKCIHPHNKQWFKTVHEYFKTLTSNTGFHTTRRSLRPSGHPYSFRERTEKSIVYLSRHRGFRFQQSSTPCLLDYKACFKPVNGPPKTFQDAMDPLRRKLSWTLIRKVLIQSRPSRIKCPDLISRATFRAILPRSHLLFNKLCFNCQLDNRGPFQDNWLPYDKRVLETSRRHPYSFRNEQRKVLFYPCHRGFVFQQSSTRHVSLDYKACFKPVNGPLRHFKTQWILYETRKQRSFESPYKAAHFGQVPRFDITGNLSSHPAAVPSINKLCFNLSLDNRGPFQDNNAGFKSLDTMELVSNSLSLLNNTMPPTCPWTAGYLLSRKCIHPQQNSGLNCP
ncbi:hypothetical protein TNCT_403521 [Trichonephila clavata]|uniref:Uncharacterized protein n=1 Tax=Trichonephila clavata TaxID=2740835 RepID=A0A8X6LU21_TRICU|nr:hypothetical protein TNCT_403521 [Trichonephila clavata]